MINLSELAFIFLFLFLPNLCFSQGVKKYYVSVYSGSDKNIGSLRYPFASINMAMKAVQKSNHIPSIKQIQVILRGGKYWLNNPLIFTPRDGGNNNTSILYKAYSNEKAVISSGMPLPKKWIRDNSYTANVWKLNISQVKNGQWVFRQLYANDKRLNRAASEMFFTKGPILKYVSAIKQYDFKQVYLTKQSNLDAFCAFQYQNNDLDNLDEFSGAEVIVYHSWEASWHTIYKIDKLSKTIYFTTPFRYPVGFFNNHEGYIIENLKEYFNKPGEWYLDKKNTILYYYAQTGEDPNKMDFVAPLNEKLITIEGDENNLVNNLSFNNLQFKYTLSPWGVHDFAGFDKNKALRDFNWLNFTNGFTSSQAAPDCGESILFRHANNIHFKNCEFSHLGNYALRLGEYTTNSTVSNCNIHDIGGGGVIVGFNVKDPIASNLPKSISPKNNKIINNNIYDAGVTFPAAVGIAIMQANHTSIAYNNIYNLPYSGISIGWTWGNAINYSTDNSIEHNHIHDVMQKLADGGGIYTLGHQPNTVIRYNYISNVMRSKFAIGSSNNGIFLDEGSSEMLVEKNIIYNIQNQKIRLNATDTTKIKWGINIIK